MLAIRKLKITGSTHPKFWFANGIVFFIVERASGLVKNPKKSGILNIKVTATTTLKTSAEVYFSGKTFSIIKTMVIG